MPESDQREDDAVLLRQLYRQGGNPSEGELVSEELLCERREEAAIEEAND